MTILKREPLFVSMLKKTYHLCTLQYIQCVYRIDLNSKTIEYIYLKEDLLLYLIDTFLDEIKTLVQLKLTLYEIKTSLVGEVSGIQGQVTVIQELLMRISENLQGFSDKDSHQEVLGDQDSPSAQPPTPTKHVQINSLDQTQIQSQQAHHATTDASGLSPPPPLSNPSVKESDTRTSRRGQRPKRPMRNVSSGQTSNASIGSIQPWIIQPWLSSSVWDNCPTRSLPKVPLRNGHTNSGRQLPKVHKTHKQFNQVQYCPSSSVSGSGTPSQVTSQAHQPSSSPLGGRRDYGTVNELSAGQLDSPRHLT